MKYTNTILLAVSALLLTASCNKSEIDVAPAKTQQPANSIAGKAKKAKEGKPFKGSMALAPAAENLPCDCPTGTGPTGTYAGTGNLTHLGLTSIKIQSCAAPLIQNGTQIGFDVQSVCAEMTAANGDQIYTYTQPYQLIPGPGGATATLQIDIIGGTGRFATATGSFSGVMKMDPVTSAASFSVDGNIIY